MEGQAMVGQQLGNGKLTEKNLGSSCQTYPNKYFCVWPIGTSSWAKFRVREVGHDRQSFVSRVCQQVLRDLKLIFGRTGDIYVKCLIPNSGPHQGVCQHLPEHTGWGGGGV